MEIISRDSLDTLVPEVILDFSPHERAAREPPSGERESRSGEKETLLSPLCDSISPLLEKKNQEKALGPAYSLDDLQISKPAQETEAT